MTLKLTADQVRRTCDPASLKIASTAEIVGTESIIGQSRALQALQFGLGIRQPGFNIFVAGTPGTGRRTAIESFLSETARAQPTPPDLCYVYNFEDPYRPKALRLPPGRGKALQQQMRSFIAQARADLMRAFESDEYVREQELLQGRLEQGREAIMTEMTQEARRQGFMIQGSPMGFALVPLADGRPMTEPEFQGLPEAERARLQQVRQGLEEELKSRMKQVRQLQQQVQESAGEVNRQVVLHIVNGLIEDLEEGYQDLADVHEHLHAVEGDIIANVNQFLTGGRGGPQQAQTQAGPTGPSVDGDLFARRYEVNLMVSHQEGGGAPVIHELNANYFNLFGRIEKEAIFGALHTDFTLIRPGSLHEANGGYLVLSLQELLTNPMSYESLKRAIQHREITIEEPMERLAMVSTRSLKPEPVPLNLKVILVGNPQQYYTLYNVDEEFRELFRVKADFDSRMPRTQEGVHAYCTFLSNLRSKDGVRDFTATAAAKLVEQGSRMAEDQEKLSTRFAELADIVREADYWAGEEGVSLVDVEHVRKAISQRRYRANLMEERLREATTNETILVDTDGTVAGQVNGLVVIDMGAYAFGRPSRITATVGIGQGGIVDIEREARLGGPIHTKGVLILSGYLADRFAHDRPLSLNARLVFEQSYEGVEGDSASCAELYALLSALTDLPVKQSIAVTGSMNQRGDVQAIGGVNQKIEGFFDVCRARGLTGEQGVIIPKANMRNLMLREDVVEAVAKGEFHVWVIEDVTQGIELLTGVPAGERQSDGAYPEGTVYNLVQKRLGEMAEHMRRFNAPRQQDQHDHHRENDEVPDRVPGRQTEE
jgi:lon-related putative ATP-dependent protease